MKACRTKNNRIKSDKIKSNKIKAGKIKINKITASNHTFKGDKTRVYSSIRTVLLICLIVFAGQFFSFKIKAFAAQKVTGTEQMEAVFREQIKKGKQTIAFSGPAAFTTTQIQGALERAGKSQNRLLSGSFQLTRKSGGEYAEYTIKLSDDAWMKVKVLKSKKAAVKAAAKALKTGNYSTNFYSEESYYDVFSNLIQQHPEYNYATAVWRSTNGAYGYRRSSTLTKKQQDAKMKAADKAAAKAVKKCIKSKMSDKQKAKAIHNFIAKNCIYQETADGFTAYGALVDGRAVCQGYAAAFNLMAKKCGLQSMAVCGTSRSGPHAWNYVKTGKKYRFVDCTWDDTDADGKGVVYTYFLITEEEMKKDHRWNSAEFSKDDLKYNKYLK